MWIQAAIVTSCMEKVRALFFRVDYQHTGSYTDLSSPEFLHSGIGRNSFMGTN